MSRSGRLRPTGGVSGPRRSAVHGECVPPIWLSAVGTTAAVTEELTLVLSGDAPYTSAAACASGHHAQVTERSAPQLANHSVDEALLVAELTVGDRVDQAALALE
jgi:hypothetical protein